MEIIETFAMFRLRINYFQVGITINVVDYCVYSFFFKQSFIVLFCRNIYFVLFLFKALV